MILKSINPLVTSIFILFLACICAYFSVLFYDFVFDDTSLVINNPYIKNLSCMSKVFKMGLWDFAYESGKPNYYRPLHTVSLMFDYKLWRLNPFGYHLTNILIHFFNATLIFLIIYLIFKNILLASIVSVLFCVHPINSSTVAYISGRADLLAAFFMLLTILFTIIGLWFSRRRIFYFTMVMIFSIGALLSRENSLVLILVMLFLLSFIRGERKFKNYIFPYYFFIFVIYLFLRVKFLDFPLTSQEYINMNLFFRLINFLYILISYVALLIMPIKLYLTHVIAPILSLQDLKLWLVLVFYFIGIVLWVKKRNNKIFNFGITWFFIFTSPVFFVMNSFNKTKLCMAENWIYLSSIGFFIIISLPLLTLWLRRKRTTFFLTTLIFFLCLTATISNNYHFRNRLALAGHILSFDYTNKEAHKELASILLEKKEYPGALKHIKTAMLLDQADPDLYLLHGIYYEDTGNIEFAIDSYEKLLKIAPHSARAYNNIGAIFLNKEDFVMAESFFKKAIALNPFLCEPYLNMAKMFDKNNKKDQAVFFYERAMKLNQHISEPPINLAKIYLSKGDFNKAINILNTALSLSPRNASILLMLGIANAELGLGNKAEYYFKETLRLNPDSQEALFNIGIFYANQGQLDRAVQNWQRAIDKDPNNKIIKENIEKVRELLREKR